MLKLPIYKSSYFVLPPGIPIIFDLVSVDHNASNACKKYQNDLLELAKSYERKEKPVLPIGADVLMSKYKIPEGKQLGVKLKIIEEEWIKNNFKITDEQIERIINN